MHQPTCTRTFSFAGGKRDACFDHANRSVAKAHATLHCSAPTASQTRRNAPGPSCLLCRVPVAPPCRRRADPWAHCPRGPVPCSGFLSERIPSPTKKKKKNSDALGRWTQLASPPKAPPAPTPGTRRRHPHPLRSPNLTRPPPTSVALPVKPSRIQRKRRNLRTTPP
jgi:hypothetical protein